MRCCAGSWPTASSTSAATSTSATPSSAALRALVELREEARGLVDLQLVAFPQQGILSFDGGEELMRRAVELGADVVGGIPHYELTREYGVASVEFAFALADEFGLQVDIHCDETDDDHSRFVEVMAAETIRLGMSGRVTASHTTAMHSYNNAYAYRLISNIARAGLHMVTNPLDNAVLQGRFDTGPDPPRPHPGQGSCRQPASTSASGTTRSWTRGIRWATAIRYRPRSCWPTSGR